jgi:SAM-dependent methyltransferase
MLAEHLSQAHDAASRRFEIIDKHVDWIHNQVLGGKPSRVLDIGCGPGLYTSRLDKLGHNCIGIDFSPASIAYAREQTEEKDLSCEYILDDIRTADYGGSHDLVMSIFGEFNVFRPAEARQVLRKAWDALLPGGFLLLEPHTYEAVVELGKQPTSWYTAEKGLFSAEPHLYLQESFWDEEQHVAIQRYHIIDAETGEVACHASSTQAYTNEAYESLLAACGFGDIVFYPSLCGDADSPDGFFMAILAKKSAAST